MATFTKITQPEPIDVDTTQMLNSMLLETDRFYTTEIEKIEGARAMYILEVNEYKHQRPLSQQHVDFLEKEVLMGRFNQFTTIVFARIDGQDFLMDGRHRMWAVANTNVAQFFNVVTIEMSEEEAAWYYGNIDIGRRRSPSDMWRAFELPDQLKLNTTEMNSFGSAIKFMMNGMYRQNIQVHKEQQLAGIHMYAPYAVEYFGLVRPSRIQSASPRRAATIALGLLTLRFPYVNVKLPERTPQLFWETVVTGDGLISGDARKLVYEYLLQSRMMRGGLFGDEVTTAAFSVRYIGHLYNAWMTGKDVVNKPFKKVQEAQKEPLFLVGVPSQDLWFKELK